VSHPFFGQEFELTQPDGATLNVRGWGDQQHARFETLDGRPVRRNPDSGYWEVQASTGAASSASEPAHLRIPASARTPPAAGRASRVDEQPGPSLAGTRWQQRRAEKSVLLQRTIAGGPLAAPPQRQTVGTFVGLCLLIDFPDVRGEIPREEIEAFCNQVGYGGFGNNGSVADYFREVSEHKLHYTNVVAPYYTARQPRAYYTDEAIPQTVRTVELINEALAHLVQSGADLSALSTDSRGFVYALNVFYAGPRVNNWARGLWPHAHYLPTPLRVRPGALAHDYQITDMGSELSLGTFCHENGHMLCDFPDLYDYGGESAGVGAYCLMCAGGNVSEKNPVHIGAYLKAQAGWTHTLTMLSPGATVTLSAGRNDFALIRRSTTEYFLIENRRRIGRDAALPDEGLAVWHIDELGNNNYEQMSPTEHYECALVQADGEAHLERRFNVGDEGDLFHAGHKDTFGAATRPSCTWWDGSDGPVEIFDISTPGKTMTFSVR
jgi:M6 family metalloprotease-like protein